MPLASRAIFQWSPGSGVGFTWTSCFGAEVNSLAGITGGNAILSSIVIDNSVALDQYCDFSISLGSVATTGAPFIGVYLYPLNQDGTSYGDGRFGTTAAGPAGSTYAVGNITVPVGTQVLTGCLRKIELPPGKFKFVVHNATNIALAASANTLSYRTYNLSTL